jgi:hypothetical protein
VKLKYPQLVIEQLALNGGDVAAALRESFHKVDVLLEDLVSAVLVLYCVFAEWFCMQLRWLRYLCVTSKLS